MLPRIDGYVDLRVPDGGNSGEIFLARSLATDDDVVLRVFGAGNRGRGPEAPGVQAAVLRLIEGVVPAPRLIEVRDVPGAAVLVTTRLPGEVLDHVLRRDPDPALVERLAHNLGNVVARIGGFPFRGPGDFLDASLARRVWPEDSESLVTWWARWRHRAPLASLPRDEQDAIVGLCAYADTLLAASPRACLVHGDLSPRNVLVDPDSGAVTGVIDWEFARAGHPLEDAGHQIRERAGSEFAALLLTAVGSHLPHREQAEPHVLLARARAADLYWIIEIASRLGEGTATVTCHAILREMARCGTLVPETVGRPREGQ